MIGSAVLVGAVRTVDVVWTRVSGRRPPRRDPVTGPRNDEPQGDTSQDETSPGVVRDRLVYSLMLDGVLRLARRAGLRDSEDD
jgi:hypothetical protein